MARLAVGHATASRSEGGTSAPTWGKLPGASKNKEEFATRMLRHAPPMVAMAQKAGLIWPNLTGHQMANIFRLSSSP